MIQPYINQQLIDGSLIQRKFLLLLIREDIPNFLFARRETERMENIS